jgi:hypothetical protein
MAAVPFKKATSFNPRCTRFWLLVCASKTSKYVWNTAASPQRLVQLMLWHFIETTSSLLFPQGQLQRWPVVRMLACCLKHTCTSGGRTASILTLQQPINNMGQKNSEIDQIFSRFSKNSSRPTENCSLKAQFVKFASGTESLLYQMHWKCLQRCITPLNSATAKTALYYQQAIHQRLAGQ